MIDFDSRSLLLYTFAYSNPEIGIYSLEKAFNPEDFKEITTGKKNY